ncbi:type II CAAX prenyl endopeptidase Rce1 family protein [Aliiroseovarius sp. YM-037]|uniref:CPBP family glutamic-type intramembrane protease n=1 Tax=Aliiroseovarius sp. YM-037 TaxID=3341728 RepID=UPI003A8112FE
MIRLVEFLVLFIGAPILMAVLLPQGWLFPVLLGMMVAGMVLLHLTPGFHWRDLWRGWRAVRLPVVVLVAVVTFVTGYAVLSVSAPGALFALVKARPEFMLVIALFYPFLSALPQELLFRVLYFRRYGAVLPRGTAGLVLNAALFSFGHLMYWSWVVAGMTFFGGLIFAWAYEVKRSFPLAFVLHSVAGVVLFALGMGVYFYSGNVVRPF